MKNEINFLCFFLLLLVSTPTFSQGPGEPYNPMTANGANGITIAVHSLNWKNPSSTVYNKIYFSSDSSLVISLDPSVLIYNGFPSTVYASAPLNIVGYLDYFKKYYWKVVEYNSIGYTIGATWRFTTIYQASQPLNETFSNGLQNWQKVGPNGFNNWSISNTSYAGGNVPELSFDYVPQFTGASAIMLNMELIGNFGISFKHHLFWYGNPFTIGCGYTTDSGNSWIPIWEITANGNIGPVTIYGVTPSNYEGYKIGFYYAGNSSYYGNWYIDNILLDGPLTPPLPPFFLQALADTAQLKIYLNWQSGVCPVPIIGYEIKRKEGLPLDPVNYSQLTITDQNTFSFMDENILPNKIYTYKIRTLWAIPPGGSHWGNEATAYVPNIVPVELQSFTAEDYGRDVKLIWSTATETNNQGFEIERLQDSKIESLNEWESVGFVPGFGTTTEVHHYSFVDESLQPGNYQYRLKQIDFDGKFEYSNIIEVAVDVPKKFSLEQNFPNPFNPTTKIKYQIPLSPPLLKGESEAGGFVTLKVYDVLGNEIATLVNEQKPTGTYEVVFDGTGLPSGIYFYQLKAGSFVETKKMILLK